MCAGGSAGQHPAGAGGKAGAGGNARRGQAHRLSGGTDPLSQRVSAGKVQPAGARLSG